MGAPDILLQFKVISTDQKKDIILLLMSVFNFSKGTQFLNKGTFLFPSINMSFLFFCFPQSFIFFPILLLVFRRFWKNVSIAPALPQSQQTTLWLPSCLSIHFNGVYNTMKHC